LVPRNLQVLVKIEVQNFVWCVEKVDKQMERKH